MPDELRGASSDRDRPDDAATAQKHREMNQRDARATVTTAGYVPNQPGSALEWMNVQHGAVTRLTQIGTGGLWIDFGTGVGRYMPWLLERAGQVIGTDFSFVSLRRLWTALTPGQQARCLLVQTDMSRLALAPGIAAGGLCVEVLQHLPTPELREAAVREMGRTLVPGAELFLVTKAFTVVSPLLGWASLTKWRMARWLGRSRSRPVVDRETNEGEIYTYRHTYREMQRLLRPDFDQLEARGIISFGTFPITLIPRERRYVVDAWLERRPVGRLFGQDMFLRLRRGDTSRR